MLSLITMLLIWSRSWASEVMVVVAVATFSTLRLHSSRSSSQSANPALPGLCRTKPGGGCVLCTPNNSLRERQKRVGGEKTTYRAVGWNVKTVCKRRWRTLTVPRRHPLLWPCRCWYRQEIPPQVRTCRSRCTPKKKNPTTNGQV